MFILGVTCVSRRPNHKSIYIRLTSLVFTVTVAHCFSRNWLLRNLWKFYTCWRIFQLILRITFVYMSVKQSLKCQFKARRGWWEECFDVSGLFGVPIKTRKKKSRGSTLYNAPVERGAINIKVPQLGPFYATANKTCFQFAKLATKSVGKLWSLYQTSLRPPLPLPAGDGVVKDFPSYSVTPSLAIESGSWYNNKSCKKIHQWAF